MLYLVLPRKLVCRWFDRLTARTELAHNCAANPCDLASETVIARGPVKPVSASHSRLKMESRALPNRAYELVVAEGIRGTPLAVNPPARNMRDLVVGKPFPCPLAGKGL